MVTAVLAVAFALLVPPALAGWALEPFLLATVVLAQLVPSVLVTAAVDGRAGVLHATYNAVNDTTLLTATAPGSMLLALTASIVVIIWAVGLLVATRGAAQR